MHLRNVFLLLPKYSVAFAAEFHLKAKVLRIVEELHAHSSASDAMAAADGGKLSKEQRAQRARDLAQSRVDLVNGLSALVPVYAETVLAYTRAFQELAVSVEAVSECLLPAVLYLMHLDLHYTALLLVTYACRAWPARWRSLRRPASATPRPRPCRYAPQSLEYQQTSSSIGNFHYLTALLLRCGTRATWPRRRSWICPTSRPLRAARRAP